MTKIDLMLDSGAFSAWTQKVEIDIDEYIAFIKENSKYITYYVCLDVIGDPEASYKNQKYMEKKGLLPIPVFHTHLEDPIYLQRYLDEGYEYIGLGGMAGGKVTSKGLSVHLDRLFSQYICGPDGMPKTKVHGFGMTSLKLMLRYPWFSVDSTSWVLTGRMGSIFVPRCKDGEYIYDEGSWKVSVSTRSPDKNEHGQHITTFPERQRKEIMEYIRSHGFILGKSSFKMVPVNYKLQENERWFGKVVDGKREVEVIEKPGLCNDYKQRDEMNIIYYRDLEKCFKPYPWAFRLKEGKKGFAGV